MRTWRRISATGAAQLKTGLQILPNREDLLENITWLIGEVNALGGEAVTLQCAQVEHGRSTNRAVVSSPDRS